MKAPTQARHSNFLVALAVCIFAYWHTSTFAYSAEVEVGNLGITSLEVSGETVLTGVGGVKLSSLSIPADAKLVFDPIATPVKVSATPTFEAGAKIALSSGFAGMTCGRVVLMTYNGTASIPAGLFDTSSVATSAAASCVLSQDAAPDGKNKQLVLTVNTLMALDRSIVKAGYYMELVRAGTNRRRYVWVDFDANGKTLDQVDWPWNGGKFHQVVTNLHVYSNDSGIKNIPASATGYKGVVEATSANYSNKDGQIAGLPRDMIGGNKFGWNDSLNDSGSGYGCFQVHRIFSQKGDDTYWNNAQVLIAWNRWGGNVSGIDEIGIGDYACHASGVGPTMDYTLTVAAMQEWSSVRRALMSMCGISGRCLGGGRRTRGRTGRSSFGSRSPCVWRSPSC